MKPEIAKVGVVGSNPIARSNFLPNTRIWRDGAMALPDLAVCRSSPGHHQRDYLGRVTHNRQPNAAWMRPQR